MKRVAWIFLGAMVCAFGIQAGIPNEWTFESDASGVSLPAAINSGTASPLAQFAGTATNFQSTVFTASATNFQSTASNRVLLCTGQDPGSGGVWTNGAILNAALTASSSGMHYLRYDVTYDFSSTNNNSGNVLGVYFTGSSGNKAAGLLLGYDKGNLTNNPSGKPVKPIPGATGLATNGSLTAIAEVNLSSNTLKVWYGLNGSTPDNYSSPAATTNITLTSITNLRFHATGDFRPDGSTNYAAVGNIRMADSWADITAPIPDFSTGPAVQIVSITVTNPSGTAGTDIGDTNTVKVVIRNLNAPASNVIASVTNASHPEFFTIISSNTPAVLTYPQYATNTFFLIANTNALNDTYTFNVNVTGSGGVNTNATFSLTVGSLISYLTNSITVVSTNGILPDKYEPGEVIDITVSNVNNGVRDVTGITNSLSADPAWFTVSNLTSAVYPSMPVGYTTSTVYRVTINPNATNGIRLLFSVTNRTASKVWPASFEVLPPVFKQGSPAVSPASITMNALEGTLTNAQVTVTNAGNAAFTFSITDDGSWGSFYTVTTGTRGISGFVAAYNAIELKDPNTNSVNISSTNAGVSSATNIGFNFPFYGTTYSNFYVTADGYIGLSNTTNVPAQSVDRTAPLPSTNGAPLIAPFWGTLKSPAGSIRTIRQYDYLVISYTGVSKESGGTNLQFQAALFTNGCIELRYKNIPGITNSYGLTNVTIGVQGSTGSYTNLTVIPVNGTSVKLTPQQDRWVSYPAQNITVGPQSSTSIVFTADASGRAATGTTFKAWFSWSTGGSNAVSVSANVTAAAPVYSAVSSLSFTGAAGQVTFVPFIITNTGTSPLSFTIRNTNAATAGYTNVSSTYNWIDTATNTVVLNDPAPASPYITAADEGFSAMIPIGFTFPFFGGSYTQFCVSVNGALRLDTTGRVFALGNLASTNSAMPAQMIAPYWGELVMDANATLKYLSTAEQLVVTWENVRQYGVNGGSNQTFQAVLKPSGDITFQYKKLEGEIQWPNTTIGLRDTASRTKKADIRQPGDWSVSTSSVSGAVYTQYVAAVGNRAVQFRSAQIQVIGYTPASGSIAAGGTAEITITGDASNQSVGNNNPVANEILTIVHNAAGKTNTLAVAFTVTNSLETAFVRAAAVGDSDGDSDGDGISDDQERIAGTDPQNADSVFTPQIERGSAGTFLSWAAPLDGLQRTYTVFFTTDLTDGPDGWGYLATVTNGTMYLDTAHSNEPVIYYKVTAE